MRKMLSVVLLVLLFAVPCRGAEIGENVSMEKGEDSESAQAIDNVALAEQLAELGRAQKSPLLLASAAQILSSAGTFAEQKQEKAEEEGRTDETKAASASVEITPESLYAEAVAAARAQNDAELAGILEAQSRVMTSRGRVSGAAVHRDRVYGRDTYNVRFTGGRRASISITGDGDDIELYVYDANGNFIGSDTRGHRTRRSVSWTPRWTGNFRIYVVNPNGRVPYVNYRLTTN